MPKLSRSPYQRHKANWSDCELCELHKTRRKIVLARGKVPCDVLLIGEAPGKNENMLGQAFVGEAGALLNHLIELSGLDEYDLAFTNLIACIPLDEDGKKISSPPKQCIKACKPRLEEFIELHTPKLQTIIRVGEHATKHVTTPRPGVEYVDIVHPAYILRSVEAQRPLLEKRVIATLTEVCSNLTPF